MYMLRDGTRSRGERETRERSARNMFWLANSACGQNEERWNGVCVLLFVQSSVCFLEGCVSMPAVMHA